MVVICEMKLKICIMGYMKYEMGKLLKLLGKRFFLNKNNLDIFILLML